MKIKDGMKKHVELIKLKRNRLLHLTTHAIFGLVLLKIVDRIMREKNFNLDEVCSRIAIEISDYGIGKICAQTIKDFYKNNSHNKTLDKISVCVRNNE